MEVDEVWEEIGEFGPAQKKIIMLLHLSAVYSALATFTVSFTGTEPSWTCYSYNSHTIGTGGNVTDKAIVDPILKCDLYDRGRCHPVYSNEFTSIVTEWDLICSKSSLPNLTQSGFFVGQFLGMWLFGVLSDTFGRKKVFFGALIGIILSGFGCGVAPWFFLFAFFRASLAFFNSGLIAGIPLTMEIVGISKRNVAGMIPTVLFALGFPLLALLASLIRNWRILTMVCTFPGVPLLLMWWVVPESPRWLLVHGQYAKARKILAMIAKGNGTQLPECQLKRPVGASEQQRASMLDLFRGRNIRHRTLILIYLWFTNCLVYYALSLNTGNLGRNKYISFSLSGLVELPSSALVYFTVDRLGRKWTHNSLMLLGGLGCLSWTVLHWIGTGDLSQVLMAVIGKFAVSGSFAVIYLYSSELFPTRVRTIGLGVGNIGSSTGGIIVPLVLLLSHYNEGLPMLVIGVAALVASVLGLSLPETLNQPMPETLADLEHREHQS